MLFLYVLAGVSALLMSILLLFSYQAFVDNLDVKFEVYAVYIHIVFFLISFCFGVDLIGVDDVLWLLFARAFCVEDR